MRIIAFLTFHSHATHQFGVYLLVPFTFSLWTIHIHWCNFYSVGWVCSFINKLRLLCSRECIVVVYNIIIKRSLAFNSYKIVYILQSLYTDKQMTGCRIQNWWLHFFFFSPPIANTETKCWSHRPLGPLKTGCHDVNSVVSYRIIYC